ncbi:protein of unknown function [Hyphomicrobium sp. MC1]|nr:protein of unknown function [Hyphomicrobium sp. MC1]
MKSPAALEGACRGPKLRLAKPTGNLRTSGPCPISCANPGFIYVAQAFAVRVFTSGVTTVPPHLEKAIGGHDFNLQLKFERGPDLCPGVVKAVAAAVGETAAAKVEAARGAKGHGDRRAAVAAGKNRRISMKFCVAARIACVR